jgi:serine/threonine protein kinase
VVFNQICQALLQVHERKVLHLDIKESNILINFNVGNQLKPECGRLPIEFKLADWGVSVDMKDQNTLNKVNPVYHRGTPRYMAPEQVTQKPVEDPYKVEVYSLGIILFKMIFKTFPFNQDQKVAAVQQKNPNFLTEFVKSSKNIYNVNPSTELLDLLKNMLCPLNRKRFSLKYVVDHKWCTI